MGTVSSGQLTFKTQVYAERSHPSTVVEVVEFLKDVALKIDPLGKTILDVNVQARVAADHRWVDITAVVDL